MPEASPQFYMRIVSVRIAEGKNEEFQKLYSTIIVPTLMTVQGCQYAFLSKGTPENNEWLSVTIWDSREDAENYESSGVFDSLTEKVAHTFSSVYQWKMTLEKEYGRKSATTEDLKVDEYAVITGRSFE
jgi:heme-degrading monooxygenase HmoA